jgi:hypothetical protein
MTGSRTFHCWAGIAATAVALVLSAPAGASVVTAIDDFMITRNGQDFYHDAFGDGNPSPAGGSFFTGAPGTYAVLGSYPAGAESGGKLALDSSLGGPFVNALGRGRTLQRSILPTDADPSTENGLKQQFHTFALFGLFDLAIPPAIGDGYGIALNDGGPNLPANTSIDLFVRREENGTVMIRFQEQDFLNDIVNTLERDDLVIPIGADQIELRLQRGDLDTDAVTAAYRFWGGGLAFVADFNPMQATVDIFQDGRGWARGAFFAVQAIPEPGTLALLGLAAAIGVVPICRRSRI